MRKESIEPVSAFLAVTFRCNSRCLHCDIWQRKSKGELSPAIYKKLPKSLRDIDITGGEPFLRKDLAEIIKVIKDTCPRARILITTNGLLSEKIAETTPELLNISKNLAIRVSLDGIGERHDQIRGVPGAYKKAVKTIKLLKRLKLRDLGVVFTLMEQNRKEIVKVLDFCKKQRLQFSLNLVYDSPVYFGRGHLSLRPKPEVAKECLHPVNQFFIPSLNPKNWAKGWFYQKLANYISTGKRPLRCGAGENFFYLDPFGDVYICHFKDWKIGNLARQSFEEIWQGEKRKKYLKRAQKCNDCWMICTAKDEMKKKKRQILPDLLINFYGDKT